MEEGRPENARQTPKMTRHDAVAVQLAMPEEHVDAKHQPADADQDQNW